MGQQVRQGREVALVVVSLLLVASITAFVAGGQTVAGAGLNTAGDSVDSDLVAWWRLDESEGQEAFDSVAGVADWVSHNFDAPEWRPGVAGNALLFDGYSTWIDRPADSEAALQLGNAFTIEAWIALPFYPASAAPIINQLDGLPGRPPSEGFFFGVHNWGGWSFQVSVDGAWTTLWGKVPLPKKEWVHVAATFDGEAGRLALYMNGKNVGEKKFMPGQFVPAEKAELMLGRHDQTPFMHRIFPTGVFQGLLDDVKIYRRALSADEVRRSYLAYEPSKVGKPNLGVRWDMFAGDPQRPQYHFLPPVNWMNEPHAPIKWQGRYHIFYQHNPNGPYWGNIHWGHAVSEDLIHWTHLPVALSPEPGPDQVGVWSGRAVVNGDEALIFYTGEVLPNQVQNLATSTDELLLDWTRNPGNPIIPGPPLGYQIVSGFRDPFVWKQSDTWYMIVGSGIAGRGGTAFLYRSKDKDLKAWEYRGPLLIGDERTTGVMWEMPQFFPLGDKWVLLVNIWPTNRDVAYFVGTWENEKFTPEVQGFVDIGEHYLSPSALVEESGRVVLLGFIKESNGGEAQLANGWSGVMALPRLVYLRPDGSLGFKPVPEIASLRGEHAHFENLLVTPESQDVLRGTKGAQVEVIAEFESQGAKRFGLRLRSSPPIAATGLLASWREETLLYYDAEKKGVYIDRTGSSLSTAAEKGVQGGPVDLAPGETVRLHIFLDNSVIEVFINDRLALTSRVYPQRATSLGLDVFAEGGDVKVKSIDIWQMQPIWTPESFALYP